MNHQRPTPRFLRDTRRAWIGGVCAGVARGLGVRAIAVRIAVAVSAVLFTTPTLLAYGIAWLFMHSREEFQLP